MIVYTLRRNINDAVKSEKKDRKKIGFVPTMGALHDGHLSLVRQSLRENDVTVISIFVNPTQFDNPDDLEKYPRTLERDLHLLEQTDKNLTVYLPHAEDLYRGEVVSRSFDHKGLDKVMEGAYRKGHFDGVATVVSLLFEAVEPDRAYFGEKDFQQLRIIQNMVEQMKFPVEIRPVPIRREPDGLAMSSRNLRLSPEMRKEAPFIYKTLKEAKTMAEKGFSPGEIKKHIMKLYGETPLRLEYFEIADEELLHPASSFEDAKHYRAFVAAYAGDIRLIDNIRVK
jgi:pantoate--beta-alanine ligase